MAQTGARAVLRIPLGKAVFLAALLQLAGSGRTTAQDCCTPSPCSASEACAPEWSFGPDGEAACQPRCSPDLSLCNHDGHCDEPQESLGNCEDDCPPACEPRGCDGRCDDVGDGCGHTLHCGSCNAGDCCVPGPCGASELCAALWSFGPEGEAICQPQCSPDLSLCNHDGHCDEPRESLGNCADDCHPACATCDGRCGDMLDGCGHTLHCPPCDAQACCTATSCGPEDVCAEQWHFGQDGEAICTPTCSPNLCPQTCAAGCATRPEFTISKSKVVVAEEVTFTAKPTFIEGATVDWDWGDGTHCLGCRPTEAHAYARAGSYLVRLTAGEPTCHTRQTSLPVAMAVEDIYLLPGDHALVLKHTLPDKMCDAPVTVSVTMINNGTTDWTAGDGYKLGRFGDHDVFTTQTRIELPAGEIVHSRGQYTFSITLNPYPHAGGYESDWQMVRENVHWFGELARQEVAVDAAHCTNLGPTPESEAVYFCKVTATDGYGHGLADKPITFTAYDEEHGDRTLVGQVTGRTDAEGHALVPVRGGTVHFLDCRVDLGSKGRDTRNTAHRVVPPLPPGSVVEVKAVAAPVPSWQGSVLGAREPYAQVALYKSGAYDKVVVLTEPMNPGELQDGPRTLADLWFLFEKILPALYDQHYDVWLVHTALTGQNLHEQAAEAAQAIQLAARDYPLWYGHSPDFNGKVAVAGVSLGGITARLATARWDSPDPFDEAWRADLQLTGKPPVSLLFFIDAPLRGAIASRALQDFLWDPPFKVSPISLASRFNANSCTFQQLVIDSTVGAYGCDGFFSNPVFGCNHDAFFRYGTSVQFPDPGGTCDSRGAGMCYCDGGPAVETVNGDGFPHGVRKVAYSDGAWGEPNRCYGDRRDRNAAGEDLCFDYGGAYTPRVGSVMYDVMCDGSSTVQMEFQALDLVPGSRQPAYLANHVTFTPWPLCSEQLFLQFGSGTFIPITSSLATDTPQSCGPFDRCYTNDYSGAHVNLSPDFIQNFFFPEMEAATGAQGSLTNIAPIAVASLPESARAGEVIALDAGRHGGTGGESLQHVWSLGDGSMAVGKKVSHAYANEGTYTVALTTVNAAGQSDETTARVHVGPPNRAPELHVTAPTAAQLDEVLTFDAGATRDPEGGVVKYAWNFGDGTILKGAHVTHAFAVAGPHDVRMTALDEEGAAAQWWGTLDVSAPHPNHPPDASIGHQTACTAAGCNATFSVTAHDPDGDHVTLSWSGCGAGSAAQLACARSSEGSLDARVFVDDGRGGGLALTDSAAVAVTSYAVGAWSACVGTGPFTCAAGGAGGCSRPGTKTRTVTPSSFAADLAGVAPPRGSKDCTETAAGYVAAWTVGGWGACSAACGGGGQTRSVTPSAWKADAPDAPYPGDGQSCNTQPCALSCQDYGLYATWAECYGAGWTYCDTRYHDDGVGGLLTCRHGYE